jgi:hypothetical protein
LPCVLPCTASSPAPHSPRLSNAIHHKSRTPTPPPPMTLDPSNPRNPRSINVTQHGFPASTQLTSRRSDKVQGLPLRHNVVPKTSTDPGQIPLSTAVSHAQLANDRAGTQGSCRRLPSRTHHGLQHPRASDATGRRVRTGSWVVRQGGYGSPHSMSEELERSPGGYFVLHQDEYLRSARTTRERAARSEGATSELDRREV